MSLQPDFFSFSPCKSPMSSTVAVQEQSMAFQNKRVKHMVLAADPILTHVANAFGG